MRTIGEAFCSIWIGEVGLPDNVDIQTLYLCAS